MTKPRTNRQQLQATIKQLKAEGKVSKKFDARQSNAKLAAEIERVTGQPGIEQPTFEKKVAAPTGNVISFQDAVNYAERKGYILQYSANGFKLELYTGTTGRPEKFLLPSDVVRFINKQVAA